MKRLPKDLADKMVLDVLISISKMDDISSDFAKDSLDIINNSVDNSILTGILLSKAIPTLFDNNELDMKATIISSLYEKHSYNQKKLINKFIFNSDY